MSLRTQLATFLIAGSTILSPVRSMAAFSTYTITELGSLGGSTSFARGLNNQGQVTGNAQTPSSTASPRLNAFLSGPNGGPLTNLGVLAGSNNFSRGYSVNDSGVVVGDSDNNIAKAFRYDSSTGTLTNLGTLGGTSAAAFGINNAGQIVGSSSNGSVSRPFLYSNGAMQDLGTLAGTAAGSGRAFGISQSGLIVGYSSRAGSLSSHATLWSGGVGGAIKDLGSLVSSSNFSQAYAVNDAGQVVGSSVVGTVSPTSSTDLYHAFIWQNGTMVDLGTLASKTTFIHSEAKALNSSGLAVGYVAQFYNSPTSGGAAVLWDQSGSILDLNTALVGGTGWTLQSAEGINSLGQIAGYGQLNGVTRAFLLTPTAAVPEPTSVALLGLGLAGLLFRSRMGRHSGR